MRITTLKLTFILVLILIISFFKDRAFYLKMSNLSILEFFCYAYYNRNSSEEQEHEHNQGTRCFLFFDNDCRTLSEGGLCGKRQLLLEEALQEI